MTGGRARRAKGDRIERELVHRHEEIDVRAERYPLSGASRFRGTGHDLDIYAFGREQAPIVAEVKVARTVQASLRSNAGSATTTPYFSAAIMLTPLFACPGASGLASWSGCGRDPITVL